MPGHTDPYASAYRFVWKRLIILHPFDCTYACELSIKKRQHSYDTIMSMQPFRHHWWLRQVCTWTILLSRLCKSNLMNPHLHLTWPFCIVVSMDDCQLMGHWIEPLKGQILFFFFDSSDILYSRNTCVQYAINTKNNDLYKCLDIQPHGLIESSACVMLFMI